MSVLLPVFFLLAPVAGLMGMHDHDAQRLLQLVSLPLLIWTSRRGSPHRPNLPLDILLAFGIGLLSSLQAHQPQWAILDWLLYLALFGAGTLLASQSPAALQRQLQHSLLAFLGCYGWIFLVNYFAMMMEGSDQGTAFWFPGFSNHRFFSHVQTLTLPLLPWLWVQCHPRWRVALFPLAALWWAMALLSSSRGTLFSLLLITIGLACIAAARPWLRIHLKLMIAGLATYVLLSRLIPLLILGHSLAEQGVFDRSIGTDPLSLREILWHQAWQMIQHAPWLGAGPMHFGEYPQGNAVHPHNIVLQLASEWGIPATMLFSWACARFLMSYRQALRAQTLSAPALLQWGLLGAMLATLADSMVSGTLVMPVSQMMVMLVFACAAGCLQPGNVAMERRWLPAWLWKTIILLGTTALLSLSLLDLPKLECRNLQQEHASGLLFPRFWTAGQINPTLDRPCHD